MLAFLILVGGFGFAFALAWYANYQIKKGKKGWV
jgi:hypothetical protein